MMCSANNSDIFLFAGPYIHSISLNKLEFINDGIIVISKGKIAHVQSHSNNLINIKKEYNIAEENVFKLKYGQLLIPGFVDTHIHGPQYPNIGLGYDLPLLDWLQIYTFPLETKFSNANFAQKVYEAIVKKTLANGTTTACYFATIHKNSSYILANCMKNLGQRGFVGKVNMNQNSPPHYIETYEESVEQTKAFIDDVLALNSPLVQPIVTPRFALSCDMKLMKALGKMANDYNLLIQTHISENFEEIKSVGREFPDRKNYTDVYDSAGLINNRTILAHGIHLNEDEINILIKKQATVSHCASSNILLQSGICPVRRYLNLGVKLSLGSDCSGGNSCSMLDCIRQTLLLSIQASMNNMGEKLSPDEVFYLATLGGAEALGLQNVCGNFLSGKDFDAILVDLNDSSLDLLEEYNLVQLFQKFLYLGDDRVMKRVFVAGKVVKKLQDH